MVGVTGGPTKTLYGLYEISGQKRDLKRSKTLQEGNLEVSRLGVSRTCR